MNPDIFTQKSLEAVRDAQRLAAEHQNQQIEQVHLLLALLRQDGGLIPQLLKKMDVSLESFDAATEAAVKKLADGEVSDTFSSVTSETEGRRRLCPKVRTFSPI